MENGTKVVIRYVSDLENGQTAHYEIKAVASIEELENFHMDCLMIILKLYFMYKFNLCTRLVQNTFLKIKLIRMFANHINCGL